MSLATEQVALLKSAYQAVLSGQQVRYGDRQLTRADAAWISSELDKWLRRVASESARASGGTAGVSIADFSGRCGSDDFRSAS